MALEVAVDCADVRWNAAWPDAQTRIAALCHHVLEAEVKSLAAQGVEISFLLAGDDDVRALNNQYRGKDAATNVLSFPSGEPLDGGTYDECGPPVLLGDIALSFDTVARESDQKGLALTDHASHLVIHGILHLLGFDHQSDDDADAMEAKEIEFCRDFGIANPYGAFL